MTEQQEQQVVWGDDGWASECGWVRAHCADPRTGEYIGIQDSWVTAGTGLPDGAYLDSPKERKGGFTFIRDKDGWAYVQDHRGLTVYSTDTKQQQVISEIGPLPSEVTTLVPPNQHSIWGGEAWQQDEVAEQAEVLAKAEAELNRLLSSATQQINIIKPAVDGGYAKIGHSKLLEDWLRYRYGLVLVPEQSGWPNNPVWAEAPQKMF